MRAFDGAVAAHRSPLARMDPLAKLCATLSTVVAISVFPAGAEWRYGAVLAMLAAVAVLARVPGRYVLQRFLAASPFIGLAALVPLASAVPAAADLAIAVTWKAFSAILLLSLLAATTSIDEIVESLRRLGAPRGLALTATLMHRYLFVLLDEWRRIARARDCRSGGHVRGSRARMWANHAAMVFVRSWERADRVAQAMQARGFRGEFPRLRRSRPGPWEIAAACALPLSVLALRII